jgi:lipoprotein signal peptidase
VFNLADALVFTGAVMLLGKGLFGRKQAPAKVEAAPPALTAAAEGD